MTTNTLEPNVEYLEDGVTTTHAIPFKFLAAADLVVTRILADGTETVLVLDTDYTVSGAGDDAGGSLVKASGGTAGASLVINRNTSRAQGFDYTPGDTFQAESHETALDRQSLVNQEQDVEIERRPAFPRDADTVDFADLTGLQEGDLLTVRGGRLALWDRDAFKGKLLGGSATGALVPIVPSDGGGIDTLATLALASGASLIGTTGGSVQSDLDAISADLAAADAGVTAANAEIARQGSTLSSLEANMGRLFLALAVGHPFPDADLTNLIPTVAEPMKAYRLHENWFVVRTLTETLSAGSLDGIYFDQFVYRRPESWAEVNLGWQRVGGATFLNGSWQTYLLAPQDQGEIPNPEFALRFIKQGFTYHSGGEGPHAYFAGFGHGLSYVEPSLDAIYLEGGGADLDDVANWAVGATIAGDFLEIRSTWKLRALTDYLGSNPITTTSGSGTVTVAHAGHGYSTGQYVKLENVPLAGINGITRAQLEARQQATVVDANSYTLATGGSASSSGSGGGTGEGASGTELSGIQVFADIADLLYYQSLNDRGLLQQGTLTPTLDGYAWQDSYGYMAPFNTWDITHVKQAGETAIPVRRDGQQYGNWNSEVQDHHFYNAGDPTRMWTVRMDYGYAMRKNGAQVDQHNFRVAFFRDLTDFLKFYIFLNSSEEGLPRTAWPLAVGETYNWQCRQYGEYRAAGAA